MTDDLMIHYFFPLPGDAPARERHHLYLHATIFVNTQIAEERRNYHPLPELLRELSVTHYITMSCFTILTHFVTYMVWLRTSNVATS